MEYDARSNLFVVNVQGKPYLRLPYVAPNVNYGGGEEFFTATITANNKVVIDETLNWNFFTFSEEIESKLGDEDLSTFAVRNLDCKSYVTNEVLDVIATQLISE